MGRLAIFVDAGYFWVQSTYVVHKERTSRDSIAIDYNQLHASLLEKAKEQFPTTDLLRVYWYDGPANNGKSTSHQAIEVLDDFKLRLGTRNGAGDQKAVDGLIIADLIGLAQNRSISDALLISGDADLTPGVIAAQGLGIRVHLLTMGPADATSPYLKAEADRKTHWSDEIVTQFATAIVPENRNEQKANTMHLNTTLIAQNFFDLLNAEEQASIPAKGSIPSDIDKRLLATGFQELKRQLDEDEKKQLRNALRQISHQN
ncbi:MAG: NYN domain-containing protein [Gammaproteobacteria bacterium]|jgi:uncharacterized LabA/DUF88 family protein|nr:NYN domain-containing protein [Gammaproteobacteria bacterium]